MNRTSQLIASALACVALAGAASAFAGDANGAHPAVLVAQRAASPAAPASGAPFTLTLQGPGGEASRLAYRPGNGWRLQQDGAAGPVARDPHLEGVALAEGPAAEDPMSVFVDGPTGYVFVWSPDDAKWKFVGRVASPRP